MLWSEESVWVDIQNPKLTFPTEKKINTKLFIDRMAAPYAVNGGIKYVVMVANR